MQKTKLIVLMAALGISFSGQAEKSTMIVFDASGSMWGQIENKTKIEIAREAITTISQGFKPGQSVGLMAYGHRRKGDCSDIEYLVDPRTNSADEIVAYVNKLQPKGKTPLSQAVKLAAEKMKYTENVAEVVLITDGVETCDLDPCSTAAELEKLGIDFTAHVIGFGLNADQGKQVSCLADVTGGNYLSAEDATSLNDALQQVILEEKPAVAAVELPTASLIAPQGDVVIGSGFSVEWTGPNGKNDYIDVVQSGREKVYGELTYAWSSDGSPAQLKAPGKVGEYDIRYIWQGPKTKHIIATTSINVVESNVSIVAPASVDAGEHFAVEWVGPNNDGDYVDLVYKGDKKTYGELSYFYTKAGSPGQLQSPVQEGDYDLRYIIEAPGGREILYTTPITVNPTEVSLAFEPTTEIAEKFTVYWTGPNNKNGYIDIVKADYNKTYGEISYFYLKDNPDSGELLAPVDAGDYQIRFVMESVDGRRVLASRPITVKPVAATLKLPTTATAGSSIEVKWTGPDRQGDYVDLMPVEKNTLYGELAYFYTNDNPDKGTLVMPNQPGNYKVRYVVQGRKRAVLAEQMITLK